MSPSARVNAMHTLLRSLIVIGILTGGGVAHAQNVTGTWQGTLNVGKELRIVITIANAAGGALTGVMYSIDQGGQGLSANAVMLQGTSLRLAIDTIGVTFEGQLGPDGNSIWAPSRK